MLLLNSRVCRWPLALSVAAVAALTACADDPIAPAKPSTATPSVQTAGTPIQLTVTNKSGGTEVGSLRWAASQIRTPDGGHITFDPRLAGETIELDAELFLYDKAIIEAPVKGITLSGKDQHRVILALAGVELHNVTVTKGNHGFGSAIYSGGRLMLMYSTVRDNRGSGPVIDADGQHVFLYNSTISRNVGTGAVEYRDGTIMSITNSTIAFNTGAGLRYDDGPDLSTRVQLSNSIISNNSENCTSIYGFEYFGTNISSDWSCGEVDIVVADPQLMPLANNGGPTMTHAIPHTSPAFNAGGDCLGDDQRYVPRDEKCDVGAFEFNDFTKVSITIDQSAKASAATGAVALTGTIKCTRNDAFRVRLDLNQQQKVNGEVVDVHSASVIPVECSTTAKAWSALVGPADGVPFQTGAARATAQTFNTPEWVTPAAAAGAVRISFTRK